MVRDCIRFDKCSEWEAVRHHCLVRFRPRRVRVEETFEVTLPLAVDAVEGRLADRIGAPYKSCVALAGLRLGTGESIGQVDLILLARSGAVALGECKRSTGIHRPALLTAALRQVQRYEDTLAQLAASIPGWLRARIDDSYGKFGFPGSSELPSLLGLKERGEQEDWWDAVSRTISQRQLDAFVAIRKSGQIAIALWHRSYLSAHHVARPSA